MERKVRAFTLIELIVTLTVVGILAAFAAPSFTNMIRSNQVVTYANSFLVSLNLARNEAAKQGVQVTIISSSGTDHQWEGGWVVFTDWNGDRTIDDDGKDPVCDTEEDCVLFTNGSYPDNLTLRTTGSYADDWLAFESSGYPKSSNTLGNGTFTLCDAKLADDYAKSITINTRGRASISEAPASSCP